MGDGRRVGAGYTHCTGPGLRAVQGERIRFYTMALGTEGGLHNFDLVAATPRHQVCGPALPPHFAYFSTSFPLYGRAMREETPVFGLFKAGRWLEHVHWASPGERLPVFFVSCCDVRG